MRPYGRRGGALPNLQSPRGVASATQEVAMHTPEASIDLHPMKSLTSYTLARFVLDEGVLPLVTETLPLAEQVRRSLLAISRHLARRRQPTLADADLWPLTPAFWGKDEHGRPRTGHAH